MKIKFNNGREYDVLSVSYESDEMGIPVDIIITGSKEVLLNIADEQCLLGFNIQQDPLLIKTILMLKITFNSLLILLI